MKMRAPSDKQIEDSTIEMTNSEVHVDCIKPKNNSYGKGLKKGNRCRTKLHRIDRFMSYVYLISAICDNHNSYGKI